MLRLVLHEALLFESQYRVDVVLIEKGWVRSWTFRRILALRRESVTSAK